MPPCYTPRPIAPTGIGAWVREDRPPMSAGPTRARTPTAAPARPRAAGSSCRRSRSSPSGRPSSGCGATPSTRCARTSRASRRAGPRLHRSLLAARRRRPRSVLRPRHDAPPGLRRGPHRRRQRPQPVRPPADRGQGRAGDPSRGHDPARPSCAWAGTPTPTDWLALAHAGRRPIRRSTTIPACRLADQSRLAGTEPVPVEVALAFHPRTLGQLLFVRTTPPARRSDRPVPRRRDHRHPPRQERELPVGAHAQHVQHGAALRPRLRGPDGLRLARARRLRRARRQARPALPPAAAVDRGGRPPRRRPRRRAACPGGPARPRPARPRPPRRHLAAVPAGRQVRLLQLAADVVPRLRRTRDRRDARRRPPPRAVPRVPARRPRRPAAGPHRRRRRRPRHRRRRDRPRPAASGAASAWPSAPGSRPPSRRAIDWRASPSTTSRPSAR